MRVALTLLLFIVQSQLRAEDATFRISPDGQLIANLLPTSNEQFQLWTYHPDEDRVTPLLSILPGYRGEIIWVGKRRLLLFVEQWVNSSARLSAIYRIDVSDTGMPLSAGPGRNISPGPDMIALGSGSAAKGIQLRSSTDFLKLLYDPAGNVRLRQVVPLAEDSSRAIVLLSRGERSLFWELKLAAGYHEPLIEDSPPIEFIVPSTRRGELFIQFQDGTIVRWLAGIEAPVSSDESLRLRAIDFATGRLLVTRVHKEAVMVLRLDPESGALSAPIYETSDDSLEFLVDRANFEAVAILDQGSGVFLDPKVRAAQTTIESSLETMRHRIIEIGPDRSRFVIASHHAGGIDYHLLQMDVPKLQLLYHQAVPMQ